MSPSGAINVFVRYLRYVLLLFGPHSEIAIKSWFEAMSSIVAHFSSFIVPLALSVRNVVWSGWGGLRSPRLVARASVFCVCTAGLFRCVLDLVLLQTDAIVAIASSGVMDSALFLA